MLGNREQLSIIENMAHSGNVPHAIMITGEQGMGKKTLAEAFCVALFGGSEKDKKRILERNFPDIIRVTHEKPAVISVDDIRDQITDTVTIKPYESGFKVYIVDEAEKMNQYAQNALLKTLEEPPEYCIIIMLVTDDRMMLDTIRSRSMKLNLYPVREDEIAGFLLEQGIDEEVARIAAAFSGGNTGRAIGLSESEEFKDNYKRVVNICKNISRMEGAAIVGLAEETVNECDNLQEFFDMVEIWYHDALRLKSTGSVEGVRFKGELNALKATQGVGNTAVITEACEQCRRRLRSNVNKEASLMHLFFVMKDAKNRF
ncbi:MAG: DNA polymerase III subunit delta [Eubacteriales bacterium]|nr:DNA polymerase III subunit delta [Eubacteriales bacterium]